MKDLSTLAAITGLSLATFNDALHPPEGTICSATTVTEARKIYHQAKPQSNERWAALKKWIELCATIEDILEASTQTHPESDDRRVALTKWCDLSKTIDEALVAYGYARSGSTEERMILLKIIQLHGLEVPLA